MTAIRHEFGNCIVARHYPEDDPIWQMPPEEARRKMLADVRRELVWETSRLAPVAVRK